MVIRIVFAAYDLKHAGLITMLERWVMCCLCVCAPSPEFRTTRTRPYVLLDEALQAPICLIYDCHALHIYFSHTVTITDVLQVAWAVIKSGHTTQQLKWPSPW